MVEPKDFFRRSVSNDDWNNGLRQYPKNTCATYDPPNLPAVAQCPDTIKAHDNQLHKIQCDIAHLTRPIDHLIHLVLSADDIPEDSELLFINFANHMRGQLASLASKITRVRMENIRKNKGIPTSDNSNLLFDPHAFNEEIKTTKALAAAFAPPKINNNNSNQGRGKSGKQDHSKQRSRGNQGRGNNSDGRGHDYRRNSDYQSDNENDRGRQRSSSFHRNKGKDTRRHNQSRGRSNGRKPSDRQ